MRFSCEKTHGIWCGLIREVPCVPWFGKGGMDTAFVTTEHTELHGKEKNGRMKRVRKNTKSGHSNTKEEYNS